MQAWRLHSVQRMNLPGAPHEKFAQYFPFYLGFYERGMVRLVYSMQLYLWLVYFTELELELELES